MINLKEMKARAHDAKTFGSSADSVSEASLELEMLANDILELIEYIEQENRRLLDDMNSGRGIPGSDESGLFSAFVGVWTAEKEAQ